MRMLVAELRLLVTVEGQAQEDISRHDDGQNDIDRDYVTKHASRQIIGYSIQLLADFSGW